MKFGPSNESPLCARHLTRLNLSTWNTTFQAWNAEDTMCRGITTQKITTQKIFNPRLINHLFYYLLNDNVRHFYPFFRFLIAWSIVWLKCAHTPREHIHKMQLIQQESQHLKSSNVIFCWTIFSPSFVPCRSLLSTLCAPLDGLCQLNDLKTSSDVTHFHFSLQHSITKEMINKQTKNARRIERKQKIKRAMWHNLTSESELRGLEIKSCKSTRTFRKWIEWNILLYCQTR